MTHEPLHPEVPIQIKKPCPKSWDELTGDESKRFCSECCLHVLNGARLTQSEATAMVAGASSRVCMRLEYDSAGAPIFRDSKPVDLASTRAPEQRRSRLARWALSAAAGLLAACNGSVFNPAPSDPTVTSNGGEAPSKMGKVCSTDLMGDVAEPPAQDRVLLGEAFVPEGAAPTHGPDAPPPRDSE